MTTGRCIFQGEFGDILIPDILTFLDMIGKTGILDLRRGDDAKRIFWERGEIVYADSAVEGERIGDYLCRNGWIDADALADAKSLATRDDELVKALLRKGAVEPAILPRAVKLLVLDIVYSLFEWRSGKFTFSLTSDPFPEKVVLRTSVSNIIMEGTRRMDEWQRIRETFPSDDTYVVPLGFEPDAIVKLAPAEREVLDCANGRRSVAGIVRRVDHDQFTVLTALLTLLGAGLVRSSAEPLPAAPARRSGDDLSDAQKRAALQIIEVFNNIFAGICDRIAAVKGAAGKDQFASTIQKGSFQKADVFAGIRFGPDGRLPSDAIVANLAAVPANERLAQLKSAFDRLLAQQVLQLDKSYPADEKKAVSELIAREKARLQIEA